MADAGGVSLSLAGGDDVGASGALGAAAAVNSIDNQVTATINASRVSSAGDLDVAASTLNSNGDPGESITSLTLGVAGALASGGEGIGVGIAGAGSGSDNQVTNDVEATIVNCNTADGDPTTAAGSINVTAQDGETIIAAAGAAAIAVELGSASAGVSVAISVAVNNIGSSSNPDVVLADIQNSKVTAGGRRELDGRFTFCHLRHDGGRQR